MGKGSQTTTQQSSTTPAPQAAAAYNSILNQAANVAATPYQAYTGELTAAVNSQQQQGISGLNQYANAAQPYLSQAAGLASNAAQPLTAQQISQYQNPYTQSVVNATQAQFNDQNRQQQAGVTGNAISQGALGGNRVGVAQGVLAGQQQLAQAPVIAGLYNQGYNQAVSTAENQQQAGLAGAYGLSNIGNSVQNAGLSGANAQIAGGTLQQQTQQAGDTANYGQYAQAQAYPFQTTQWQAGIDSAIAPGLGSSTTGTTTGPAPNMTAQLLGGGVTAASLALSDRDAKKNIHKIGSLNDGTPIYRYQYHGSDEWHVGPMAQDVEKHHPHAVHQGVGGFKYVDLKAATDDSIRKAGGGGVAGFAIGGTPWSMAQGWVPTFGGASNTAPQKTSAPSPQNPQTPSMDWSKIGSMKANPNGLFAPGGGDPGSQIMGDIGPSSYGGPSGPMPLVGGLGFARGGVAGYADGGAPDDLVDPGLSFADRSAPVAQAIASGDFDPRGANSTNFTGTPGMQASNAGAVPMPQSRPASAPVVAADDDEDETPAKATPTAGVAGAPAAQPYARDDARAGFSAPATAVPAEAPQRGLGIGLGLLSPNAQSGLLAAGLGMLASRSSNLGNAIGEGGLAGLTAYSSAEQQDRKVADEAKKLADAAKQHAEEMALKTKTQTETERHNKATEAKEYKPQLISQTDPNTGETQHLLFDPNKQKLVPLQAPVNDASSSSAGGKFVSAAPPIEERRKAPQASPEARDESFYKYMQDKRPPGYADIVRGVADYEIDPNREASLQKGARDRLYRDVKQYDPTYDQTHFQEKTGVIQNFSRGPASQAVNSLNVSVAHLGTLTELGDALQNGNIPLVNKIGNAIAVQTGRPAPTNFDAAKEIVGDEVVKAVIGGVNSQADREAIKHLITSTQTPAQLKGVIQTFTALLGGQLDGQRQRYQAGTGLNNFDQKYLAPATQEALKRGLPNSPVDPAIARMVYPSGIPQSGSSAPQQPAAPQTKVINGVTYVNRNGQWFAQ